MTNLTTVHVKNFQSVADLTVDFDKFTVMVGQSNSGKSAFLRGVRACVRNSFVPSNVRQGTTKSEVDVLFDDATQVSIERGKSLSTYKMNNGADVFTKSARAVPEEVESALKFPLVASAVDPFFSFQFDKPFLLSESGSTAAQVLGSLTNISLLHQAVRESNRRRQEVLNVVKVREQDVRQLQLDLESYRDLDQRREEVEKAQQDFDLVVDKQKRVLDLNAAVENVRFTEESCASLTETSPKNFDVEIVQLRQANDLLKQLSGLLEDIYSASSALRLDVAKANKVKSAMELTNSAYHERLVAIGQCPMCGQPTSEKVL